MSDMVPMYGFGGGAALNFKIVGGTEQPANPKEHTIWINTDAAVTSWIISAVQPETPSEGMVWISTGTSSSAEFNALKKNGINVYPLFAKQYVSGAWVDKTAKSYQNGAWVDWFVYLLNRGKDNTDLTGGWQAIAKPYNANAIGSAPTVTQNANSITLKQGSGVRYGMYATKNKIDFADVKRIQVVTDVIDKKDGSLSFGLWSNFGSYIPDHRVSTVAFNNGDTVTYLDAPDSGSYYLAIVTGSGSANVEVTVRDIILD